MRKHQHSHKPRPKFYGKGPWFIGMELEFEAPNFEAHDKGLYMYKTSKTFYAKADGSLSNLGWELVTHPIEPEMWLKEKGPVKRIKKLVTDLHKLGYTSHDNGRCGLHFHISKTAFRGYTARRIFSATGRVWRSSHIYWFRKIVHGDLFSSISQRSQSSMQQWCSRQPIRVSKAYVEDTTRYKATVVYAKTVEIRIFRGSMRWDRVRKAVEAVIAAVEFSRNLSSKNWHDSLDSMFVRYVIDNFDKYPNLFHYLIEIGCLMHADVANYKVPQGNEEVVECAS